MIYIIAVHPLQDTFTLIIAGMPYNLITSFLKPHSDLNPASEFAGITPPVFTFAGHKDLSPATTG